MADPARPAWISLGANLGDAADTVRQAIERLARHPRMRLEAASPLYRSAPVEAIGPDYVNAVARFASSLEPLELLHELQTIENEYGRKRSYRNAPRTLDLDLLMVDNGQPGGVAMDTPRLTLPHPRMHLRAFALRPLLDIDPGLILPQGRAADLLAAITDQEVRPL